MAGSNDFSQHNPTEANQEPNSTFAADSLTTGGIGTDAILPSLWLNARWYQDSTVCAALMQMMANKNYNVSVSNLATLISVFSNILTQADLKLPLVTVGYSPTPSFNAGASNGFDIVLGGNVTGSTLTGQQVGQILTFIVTQTSGGGATFVPPTNINGWQPINTAPNSVTIQQFIVKEDTTIWPLVSITAVQGNVFGSRSYGTVYQNNSGSPMEVSATGQINSGVGHNGSIQLLIGTSGGSLVTPGRINGIANGPGYANVNGIVPAGSFYQVNTSIPPTDNTAMTLVGWEETVLILT